MRRLAILLATLGLALTLVGAGLSAAFTQSASIATLATVGDLGVMVRADGGCTGDDRLHVTCSFDILASSGSQEVRFFLRESGSIPVSLAVTTTLQQPDTFSVGDVRCPETLGAASDWAACTATIAWHDLDHSWLGWTGPVVTFEIAATA